MLDDPFKYGLLAALAIALLVAAVTDLRSRHIGNWLNGGGYMIYTSAANTSFTGNRVGRDHHFGLLYDPYLPFAESGNVWDDDGSPVTFQK